MDESTTLPKFPKAFGEMFAIKDRTRKIAALQEHVLPSLRMLIERACASLQEIYHIDYRADSSFFKSPNPNPAAQNPNKDYHVAYYGISPKRKKIMGFGLLLFQANADGVLVAFDASKPKEAQRALDLLRKHQDRVLGFMDSWGHKLLVPQQSNLKEITNYQILMKCHIDHSQTWFNLSIRPGFMEYPIVDDEDRIEALSIRFLSLFPFYQAITDLHFGRQERLLDYMRCFEESFQRSDPISDPATDLVESSPTPAVIVPRPMPLASAETGRRGEALFDRWLVQTGHEGYRWMNRDAESGFPYDFHVNSPRWHPSFSELYIDVKTTTEATRGVFFLSYRELEFASTHENYQIGRVFALRTDGSGKDIGRLVILSGMHELARELIRLFPPLVRPGVQIAELSFRISSSLLRIVDCIEVL